MSYTDIVMKKAIFNQNFPPFEQCKKHVLQNPLEFIDIWTKPIENYCLEEFENRLKEYDLDEHFDTKQ